MSDFKRKMPKYKKIPQLKINNEIINRIKARQISDEEQISVYTITDLLITSAGKEMGKLIKKILSKMPDKKHRLEAIRKTQSRLKQENDFESLFSLFKTDYAKDLFHELYPKLIKTEPHLYQYILDELEINNSDQIFDNSLLFLGNQIMDVDFGNEIISRLEQDKFRDPQEFASLLMILGYSSNNEYKDFLYSLLIFFEDNFPGKNYWQEPFIALRNII